MALLLNLGLNRNLTKANIPETNSDTISMAADQHNADVESKNNARGPGGQNEAKNILTGTVIVACIIKTSDGESRVELSGNDMRMFDASYMDNGTIKGDTSTLKWIRSDDISKYFIMEKRVSVSDDLDNVWSFYASPPATGKHNWMFIGRDGIDDPSTKNLSVLRIGINGKSTDVPVQGKPYGSFSIEYNEESLLSNVIFFAGSSRNLLGAGMTGSTSYISASDGGITGLCYFELATNAQNYLLYLLTKNEVMLGAKLLPDADNVYDIGSATAKVKDVHVGGRLNVGKVTDAGPMTATNGTVGDIVFNTSNTKFYGCTATGTPGTWAALS